MALRLGDMEDRAGLAGGDWRLRRSGGSSGGGGLRAATRLGLSAYDDTRYVAMNRAVPPARLGDCGVCFWQV